VVEDGVVLAALLDILYPDSDVFPVGGTRMLVQAIKRSSSYEWSTQWEFQPTHNMKDVGVVGVEAG
jgi:hypothetical protein